MPLCNDANWEVSKSGGPLAIVCWFCRAAQGSKSNVLEDVELGSLLCPSPFPFSIRFHGRISLRFQLQCRALSPSPWMSLDFSPPFPVYFGPGRKSFSRLSAQPSPAREYIPWFVIEGRVRCSPEEKALEIKPGSSGWLHSEKGRRSTEKGRRKGPLSDAND